MRLILIVVAFIFLHGCGSIKGMEPVELFRSSY